MEFHQEVHEEENLIKDILNRFKKRNFSGTTGQALKNSTYQLTQNLIYKLGSLIFTIIIARILLPEKMGLYTLALSTIILLGVFGDLGIGEATITYVSKMLGFRKEAKAKGYLKKLFFWKINLVIFTSIFILGISYFISEYFYQKPIFYALLVGVLYYPIVSMIGFIENVFKADENFKIPLIKEILFQISRNLLVPLILVLFLGSNLTNQSFVVLTLFLIVFSHLVPLLFLMIKTKKLNFLHVKAEKLKEEEVSELKKFIYPLSVFALAGVFFGYIDTLMLGRYVSTSYIAYYGAAFSLIASGAMVIGFASGALMPIFARKTGNSLEKIFKKTRLFVIFVSILGAIFAYFISYYAIFYSYGVEYLTAVPLLKLFSVLILFLPLLALYNSYFISQGKTREVAWLLIFSTVLNIVFNFIAINYGLKVGGEMGALYGALAATILSRILYLIGFFILKREKRLKEF